MVKKITWFICRPPIADKIGRKDETPCLIGL